MAIDYGSLLTDDQKKNILTQRLNQFANEAFQHQLNAQVAEANNDTAGVDASNAALAQLDTAIQVHQEALAALPVSTDTASA